MQGPWMGWVLCALLLGAGSWARAEDAVPTGAEKTVEQWAADLGSEDVDARRRAVYALWQRKQESGAAAVALAHALKDGDAYVRSTAKRVFDQLEPFVHTDAWRQAIAVLVQGTRDQDLEIRRASAVVIWKASSYIQESDPFLTLAEEFLADPDAVVRANGAGILWHLWQLVAGLPPEHQQRLRAALSKLAAATDSQERLWAAKGFIGLLDAGSLGVLAPLLGDEDAWVREAATYSLSNVALDEPVFSEQISLLLPGLRDPSPLVRAAAVNSIRGLGCPPAAMVHLVGALMGDEDPDVRYSAAFAVASGDEGQALSPLLEALDSEHAALRNAAAAALPTLGPLAAQAVARLTAMVRTDEALTVRVSAAMSLGSLGSAGRSAVPALLATLADGPPQVKAMAASALYGLALAGALDRGAAPALAAAMGSVPEGAALYCAQALGVLREQGASAADALAQAYVASQDMDLRAAVAMALRWHGEAAAPYLDLLREARTEENRLGASAIGALVALSPDPEERDAALGRLAFALEPDQGLRAQSLYQLRMLGPLAAQAAPRLRAVLAAETAPGARADLAITLLALEPQAQPEVKEVLAALVLELGESAVSRLVCRHVAEVGRPLGGLADIVSDSLDSDDPGLRRSALNALRGLASSDPTHLELAASLLGDPDRFVRREAANTVATLAGLSAGEPPPPR